MNVVTKADQVFEHANLHMRDKLRYFGCQSAKVIKYICAKLRKYRGEFFESNRTIADACEVSVRTVQNAIKRAEQLEIFVISERLESTFNGKMRRTSNLIQLLPHKAAEIARKVVATARKVASVLRSVTRQPKQRQRHAKPVREEMKPDWLGKEQVDAPMDGETSAEIAALQAKLRQKYAKG